MADSETLVTARANLTGFTAEMRDNFESVAEVVGAPLDRAVVDPPVILGYLQLWVDRLPVDEMEQDDWVTLHTDLVSVVARLMQHYLGAAWEVAADTKAPGYRYRLTATDRQGLVHRVDPFEVVAVELQQRPIEVARILASAQLSLGEPTRD